MASDTTSEKPIEAIICFDGNVYARYRAVLRHLCVGLIDIISSIRLITPTEEAQSLTLGSVQTVLHEELRWPFKSKRFRQLADTLAARPPTVVHAMSAGSYEIAESLAAEFDADLVYQVTATEDIRALRLSTYGGLYRVVCASKPLVDRCGDVPGLDENTIALIRPGVICAAEPTCFCHDDCNPTILSTADLTDDGGVETLLHALHLLENRGYPFLAFLLGEGPEEWKLRQLAKELELGSCVTFARPEGNVVRAMVGADVFVQPGVEKSLSARSLQALGQGMAVVGVAGGVHDAYVPDVTAIVVKAPTPTDLAAGIERLLLDHGLAQTLATNAIAYMRKQHTMTVMAELTAKVYQEMAIKRASFRVPTTKRP